MKKRRLDNLKVVCGQGEKVKKVETFRRCHVCGQVSESVAESNEVLKHCAYCHKAFAPFFYYDDFLKPINHEGLERPPQMKGEWPAIQGLTAYW